MRFVVLLIAFCLGFIVQNMAFCQHGNSKFGHITTNDGLSDNYVQEVYQDSYGYLWFGTWNGVTRFDGYSFKIYRHSLHDANTPDGTQFYGIKENKNHELWMITMDGGLMRYNRAKDNFSRILFDNDSMLNFKKQVLEFVFDFNDNIWLSTNYGIGMLDKQMKWHWYLDKKTTNVSVSRGFAIDRKGVVWGATRDGSIYRFDETKKNFVRFTETWFTSKVQIGSEFFSIYFDKNNKLWLGTKAEGAWCVDLDKKNITQYSTQNSNLLSNEIAEFYEDSKENFWIGTVNGGVSVLRKGKNDFVTYSFNEYNSQSINSNSVAAITEDSGGNIWFGTHGGGANCLGLKENLIIHYRRDVSCPNSLSNNYVSSFYESPHGGLWIGTDGGGLNYFDRKTETFEAYGKQNGALSNVVLNISPDSEGNLWLSSWGGGVMYFDTKTHKIQSFFPDIKRKNWISFPHSKWVYYLNDTVWIATHGDGVNIYIPKQKRFITKESSDAPFNLALPKWGNKIYKDGRGWLWFLTSNGLYMWDRKELHSYISHPDDLQTLSSNVVVDIFEDSNGNLWIGTNEGLDKYEPSLGGFIRYRNKYPLLPNGVKKILEDSQKCLWISSNTGIYIFNPITGDIKNYNIYDGLQGNQFFERSGIVTANGDIYFGGLSGFNIIRPQLLKTNQVIPPVYITDFLLFNQSQKLTTAQSSTFSENSFTLEQTIDYSKSKMISFEYVAINYIATQKNQYAYILENFDSDWHFVGTERKATYTNLPPGTYNFKVKAANNDGIWNEKGAQFKITILPPWYMAWWFRIASFLLIASIVVGFYLYRIRVMSKQNKLLEESVQLRTQELAQKNQQLFETNKTKDKFFSIIAHDLKNPMGSVIGLSELLMNNFSHYSDEKKVLFIKTIHESTTHLYSLLVNLLEWARSQTGSIRFEPQNVAIDTLIEETIQIVTELAAKKEILITTSNVKYLTIWGDANMLKTTIRNILSNSIKFTPRGGNISVSVKNTDEVIVICIADSGVGMTEQQLSKLFSMEKNSSTHGTENESGTGLGLLLCKEFINQHGGIIRVESAVGKGSQFYIELPNRQHA